MKRSFLWFVVLAGVASGFQRPAVAADLVIDNQTYTYPGGTNIYDNIVVGQNGNGSLNQNSGSLTASGTTYLGQNNGGRGTVTMSGANTRFTTGDEIFGADNNSQGTFTQSAGTHTVSGTLVLGDAPSDRGGPGFGTYNLNSGTLIVNGAAFIGRFGLGTFIQTGGTFDASQSGVTRVGFGNAQVTNPDQTPIPSTVTLSGADSRFLTTNEEIGVYPGGGRFTQNSGTHTVSGTLTIGRVGDYALNGGTLTVTGGMNIAAGTFTQTGGTVDASQTSVATLIGGPDALAPNLTAFVTLSGANSQFLTKQEVIGVFGRGNFGQTAGTHTVSESLTLAQQSGSTGLYDLVGGVLSSPTITGGQGSSTFHFNGGTLQAGASGTNFFQGLNTANVRDGGARIDTAGFNVTIAQPLLHSTIGGDAATDGGLTKVGAGTLTLTGANTYNGGTFFNGGVLNAGSAGALGTGLLKFGGGALQYSSANQVDYSARIANSAGAIVIDTNGQNVNFASALASTNTGGLSKLGAGTLTLTANNAYAGSTLISAWDAAIRQREHVERFSQRRHRR